MAGTYFAFGLLVGLFLLFYRRTNLQRQMNWGGVLSLPVLWLPLMFLGGSSISFSTVIAKAAAAYLVGAIASGAYHYFFAIRLSLGRSHRHQLIWLLIGPIVLGVTLLAEQPFVIAVILGLLADVLVIFIVRPDLIWDSIFSALFVSILYMVMFVLLFRGYLTSADTGLWFTELSGLTAGGVPIEEIISAGAFGALWGPIFIALKDWYERD